MNSTIANIQIAAQERFSLADTLDCGQCFRWQRQPDGWYEGVVEQHFCRVRQEGDSLLLEQVADADLQSGFWADYFDLGTSYADIRQELCGDDTLAKAAAFAPGIRILKQHAWETLISFIISQNNNIGRIKGIVARLCEQFGDELAQGVYAFPHAQSLAELTVEDLAPLRSGFRARYILDAARKVAGGEIDLDAVRALPLEDARLALRQIHGVGPKVAECALLYGFGKMDCFPMDVWMKRAMQRLFPDGLPLCAQAHAGIAQQYIFHYARVCPGVFE